MIVVAASAAMFLLAGTSLPALHEHSVALRLTAILLLVVPVLWRKRNESFGHDHKLLRALPTIGLGYVMYLVSSTIAHERFGGFGLGLVAFLLVSSVVGVLHFFYTEKETHLGLYAGLVLICGGSLFAMFFAPEIALEHARLRGIFENANQLGFTAFLLGVVALVLIRNRFLASLGVAIALGCLILSGSRASMLSLLIATAGFAIGGLQRARLLLFSATIAILIVWLQAPESFSNLILLRTMDSRSVGFDVLTQVLSESFWLGQGAMPTDVRVAGSVFAAGITGGMAGLLGLGLMYVGMLQSLSSRFSPVNVMIIVGILHSLFESWILSFSAPMLFGFFAVLLSVARVEATHSDDTRNASNPLIGLENR